MRRVYAFTCISSITNQVSSVKQKFKKSNTIIAQESNLVSRTKSMPKGLKFNYTSKKRKFDYIQVGEFLVLEMDCNHIWP
jgi:uncharacterized protein (DUF2344 family)